MKLVITIPAYNEEKTLAKVISELPKSIPGVSSIKVLVVNDGSTDNTLKIARSHAHKVISFPQNLGLATAFKAGLNGALKMGADIIVNTDADGQYVGSEIPRLVQPILHRKADMVLGSRFLGTIEHMPASKFYGNRIATFFVGLASGITVSDGQTGFRAFSRRCALMLNVVSDYTYTQETIVQAAHKRLKIVEVPVTFRRRDGHSRLISSVFSYAKKSAVTLLRTYRDYQPLMVFSIVGGSIFAVGGLLSLRVFLHYLRTGGVSPYLPTAILSAILLIVGFQILIFGLLADMLRTQKALTEEVLYREKKREYHFED